MDFECQAVALANPNAFRDQICKKYGSPQRRRLTQAENEMPLPGSDEQMDVSIVYTVTIQCTPAFALRTSVKLHKPANHFWSNPFMVKCHISPCGA